uniref:condensin-2 complex subunit H2 n=1 Tax=Myxine glutinosa TaxID=7769 RepID=UPI00358F36BE
MESMDADVETRFVHLLKPIRDLAENWNVDVASQLEEYLEQLEKVCISFDGGKTSMNFVEAALLIQGSACVYSRKVEYLYTLVFQTLDMLHSKTRQTQKGSGKDDGASGHNANFDETNEEFLMLDDFPMGKTQLPRETMPMPRDSLLLLAPITLIAVDDVERRNTPLYSRKGELLGSQKDYKMNMCRPQLGVYLLESVGSCDGQQEVICMVPVESNTILPDNQAPAIENEEEEDIEDVAAPPDCDVGDEMVDVVVENLQMAGGCEGAMQLRERVQPNQPDCIKAVPKKVSDPWENLDAYSLGPANKPFKQGKCWVLPHSLVSHKRKRKGAIKIPGFHEWFAQSYYPSQCKKAVSYMLPELDALYWMRKKKILSIRQHFQKHLILQGCSETVEIMRQEEEEARDLEGNEIESLELEREHFRNEEQEELPFAQSAIEDLESAGGLDVEHPVNEVEGIGGGREHCAGYEELVQQCVELYLVQAQKFSNDTQVSKRVQSWQEMVCPALQEQEDRSVCDIRIYQEKILNALGSPGVQRSFAKMVEGLQPHEASRWLLASLQMANDGNLELIHEGDGDMPLDCLELQLLHKELRYEMLDEYRAPSVIE